MAKRQAKHPLEDNPFMDGLLDWMDSPEGQLSIEVSDELWMLMDDVHIDPQQRQLLWPDAQRLIRTAHPECVSALPARTHRQLPRFLDRTIRPGERYAKAIGRARFACLLSIPSMPVRTSFRRILH